MVDVLFYTRCGGCLSWWMSGVVDFHCSGWWISYFAHGVVDVCVVQSLWECGIGLSEKAIRFWYGYMDLSKCRCYKHNCEEEGIVCV